MQSVAEALRGVLERVPRTAVETVELGESVGRVLAVDITATRPLPGFDNSAMDGYAARSAELPGTFPIAAVVPAGAPYVDPLPEQSVARIFTGAPMPPDLDTVVIQEDAAIVEHNQ